MSDFHFVDFLEKDFVGSTTFDLLEEIEHIRLVEQTKSDETLAFLYSIPE
jgi:hypothetical protein